MSPESPWPDKGDERDEADGGSGGNCVTRLWSRVSHGFVVSVVRLDVCSSILSSSSIVKGSSLFVCMAVVVGWWGCWACCCDGDVVLGCESFGIWVCRLALRVCSTLRRSSLLRCRSAKSMLDGAVSVVCVLNSLSSISSIGVSYVRVVDFVVVIAFRVYFLGVVHTNFRLRVCVSVLYVRVGGGGGEYLLVVITCRARLDLTLKRSCVCTIGDDGGDGVGGGFRLGYGAKLPIYECMVSVRS